MPGGRVEANDLNSQIEQMRPIRKLVINFFSEACTTFYGRLHRFLHGDALESLI